ncbi:MAG TPA: hypothetical protein VKA01_13000 [Vicinamibacteria bacterium]|nr:hypothetical protein [Vicinamibacteria bacterium]
MKPLRDDKGCLTPAGLMAVQKAAVGQAPAELAGHVAACARCQERLLAGGILAAVTRTKKNPPPRWRLAVVLVAVILLLLSILFTLGRLTSA